MGVVLLMPVLHLAALHVWHEHTLDGLPAAFAVAVFTGAVDTVDAALSEPGRAAVYTAVVWLLWRFAFGRPGRR